MLSVRVESIIGLSIHNPQLIFVSSFFLFHQSVVVVVVILLNRKYC